MQGLFQWLSFVNLNALQFFNSDCWARRNLYADLVVITVVPLLVCAACMGYALYWRKHGATADIRQKRFGVGYRWFLYVWLPAAPTPSGCPHRFAALTVA